MHVAPHILVNRDNINVRSSLQGWKLLGPMPIGRGVIDTSNSRPSKTKPSLPKSITYDGIGDWQAFITKFRSYADGQTWSSKERRDLLSWNLMGKASEFYSRMVERDPNLDYFEAVERLGKRFDIKDLPETLQI